MTNVNTKQSIVKTYYPINVETARFAHSINSFRDFDPNRQPSEYRQQVDEAWELVESKAKDLTPDNLNSIKWLADRYARKLAQWYNDYNRNDASCPSIMISGAGNFPVRKKEKQNSRRNSLFNELKRIEDLLSKIRNIAYSNAIKSNDPNVIELLEIKLEKLQVNHEEMKAINAHWRKHGTMKGFEDWTDERAAKFDKSMADLPHYLSDIPYASYSLSNSNQNIKSVKDRIERIKKDKAIALSGGIKYDCEDICEVVENEEQMRIQLVFDGKPSEEERKILKSGGLIWSPRNTAWQRQLNNNGRYAVKRILEKLRALESNQ